MKLKITLSIGVILVIVLGIFLIWPTNDQNIHMKNQKCPVSGNPVNGKDSYIHKGKKYNLCSDKCQESLSKNPEKYLSE